MEIVKATFTVGFFTLFSRLAGFIRELTLTAFLGAGVYTDAFLVAVKLSSVCRRIFAEGAFSASFLPRFSKVLSNDGKKSAGVMFSDIFMFLLVVIGIFSAIVITFFPSVLSVLASGFDPASYKFELTVTLGRLCFPYLILMSIASLFSGVLNALNSFALPAAAYSLLSIFVTIGVIIGHFIGANSEGIVYISVACVILSGITQGIILYKSIKKRGLNLNLRFHWMTPEVKDVMVHMIPGIIAAGVWQLNLLVDTTISSYLPTGSITCINLADRLNQFPLGTLGIALSTALLPLLSNCVAKKDFDEANKQLSNGIVFAFFLTFFATSLLLSLNIPSVAVAFQRGMFGEEQVEITANALTGFVIGLPAYVLSKVFASVYFSFGNTKTPVKFGIISVFANVIFLFMLVPFLKYFGIALCTSLSAFINATLLICFSHKKMKISFDKEFWIHMLVQLIAGVINYFVLVKISEIFWISGIGERAIKLPIYIGMLSFSCVLYFTVNVIGLYVFGSKKWRIWRHSAWM